MPSRWAQGCEIQSIHERIPMGFTNLSVKHFFLQKKVLNSKDRDARNAQSNTAICSALVDSPGRVAQSVGHLTRKSGVLGSIPDLATYFRFSFRFFKKGSCQFLAKVCARSTG